MKQLKMLSELHVLQSTKIKKIKLVCDSHCTVNKIQYVIFIFVRTLFSFILFKKKGSLIRVPVFPH